MTTVGEIRERLTVLSAMIPDVESAIMAYDDPTAPLPAVALPAMLVFRPGRATHGGEGGSTNNFMTTRRWLMWLIVTEKPDQPTPEQNEEAEKLCDPFLDSVPRFFFQHSNLQLEDTDQGIVEAVRVVDDGTREYQAGGKRYAGIPFPLDITTTNQIWSETL